MITVTLTDCNTVEISADETTTFTIKKLNNSNQFDVVEYEGENIEDISITSSLTYTYEFGTSGDGLYGLQQADSEDLSIFILDCNIETCRKSLYLDFLCSDEPCKHFDLLTKRHYALKFQSLSNVLYAKWNSWTTYKTIGSVTNQNSITTNVILMSDLIKQLNKICTTCNCGCSNGRKSKYLDTTVNTTDCGCSD